MDKYTANRYIWLKQQIAAGGGSVPQELIDEVNALDATVNGDETQEPPVVGLVDIVGDLENSVEDLDTTVNGDSTTTPATPGLVDRVVNLELSVNGDPESVPPILPTVGNIRYDILWENPEPTAAFTAQNITLDSSDYDLLMVVWLGDINTPIYTYPSICINGYGSSVSLPATSNYRLFTRVSDTSYSIDAGGVDSTSKLVPLVVYGIKIL